MNGKVVGGIIAAVAVAAVAWWAVDVDLMSEGELPSAEVNVDVDPGKLPEVAVDTADVEIGTQEETVKLPEVDVKMVEKQVTLPDVRVEAPEAGVSVE